MFIAVLVNLHLVRDLMIEGCVRLMFAIVITGFQNFGYSVELGVSVGVHSYVAVNDDWVMRGQYSKAVCCWHCLIG